MSEPVRKLRYSVAASLDGFIAGPELQHDWIVMDPAIDFASFFASIDTVLVGRRTFLPTYRPGAAKGMPGMESIVCSRTLDPADYPGIRIERDAAATVRALKAQPGKHLWLMGGGSLFRSLLHEGLVDSVEVAIVPVLLGDGVPLIPGPYHPFTLTLESTRTLDSGLILTTYRPKHPSPSRSKRRDTPATGKDAKGDKVAKKKTDN